MLYIPYPTMRQRLSSKNRSRCCCGSFVLPSIRSRCGCGSLFSPPAAAAAAAAQKMNRSPRYGSIQPYWIFLIFCDFNLKIEFAIRVPFPLQNWNPSPQ